MLDLHEFSALNVLLRNQLGSRDIVTGGTRGTYPPRFCNKQRSVIFIFRKCTLFLRKKVPSKCCAPPSLTCFLRLSARVILTTHFITDHIAATRATNIVESLMYEVSLIDHQMVYCVRRFNGAVQNGHKMLKPRTMFPLLEVSG